MENQNIAINSRQDLINHINKSNITSDSSKTELVIKIIEKNPEIINDLTSSTLSAFIKDLGFEHYIYKKGLAIAIIKQNSDIIKSSKALSDFINELGFEYDISKRYLAIAIIENKHDIIKDFTSSTLSNFIVNQLEITHDSSKQDLAIAIIEKNPKIINDLTSSKALSDFIVNQLKITDDDYKREIAIAIIEKKPEIIKDLTSSIALSDFINELGFEHDIYKRYLAIAIIKQKPEILGSNEKEKGEGLSELIKAFGNNFHYRVDSICYLLKELPQNVIIDFKTLNNNLYQHDHLKKELILEAIDNDVLHKDNFLKCGFDEIKTDDIYFDILAKAKAKNIITDLDVLNHNKGRLSSEFTSMKKLFDINLEENKLNDIFANEGNSLNTIASWFANPNNQFNIKQYKLSDIIEYCRSGGKLTELNLLFKEEFKAKIKNLYIPSSQKVITNVDIKQIAELTGFSIKEVAKKHISIGEMASRLQPLFAGIKEATLDDVNEIKNDKIKEILTKTLNNSVDDQDTENFYKEITGLDIKKKDTSKLKAFISGNKDILTYIFKKEDGLARLAGVMHSIGDGCGANIANNLNNMALSFLLDDNKMGEKNKNKNIALKLIYESLIAGGILKQALEDGDHLGSSSNASIIKNYKKDNANILDNRFITCDHEIEAIIKISRSDKHSDIVPQEIKNLALENYDLLDKFNEIIAINAINFLIKNGANQSKITNNNSAIYREIDQKIQKPIKQVEQEAGKIKQTAGDNDTPNNETRPTRLQRFCSWLKELSCC